MTAKPLRKAPSSLRIGEERKVRFNAYRDKTGLSFTDAVHTLMDVGLADAGFPNPKSAPKSQVTWQAPKAPKAAPAKPNGRADIIRGTSGTENNAIAQAHQNQPLNVGFGPPPSPPGSRLKQPPKAKGRWQL